jgi:hypothetical protein
MQPCKVQPSVFRFQGGNTLCMPGIGFALKVGLGLQDITLDDNKEAGQKQGTQHGLYLYDPVRFQS